MDTITSGQLFICCKWINSLAFHSRIVVWRLKTKFHIASGKECAHERHSECHRSRAHQVFIVGADDGQINWQSSSIIFYFRASPLHSFEERIHRALQVTRLLDAVATTLLPFPIIFVSLPLLRRSAHSVDGPIPLPCHPKMLVRSLAG